MEEERPDEMEMAKEENEKREAEKGKTKGIKNKNIWICIVLVVLFLTFMYSFTLTRTQHWDSARRSVGGIIYHDYYKTILSGDFMSWSTFEKAYEEKMPGHFGWFTQYDPPAYAMFQGVFFLFVGVSYITARLTTGLLILLLAPFLFLLARKLLKSNKLGLLTVALFLLSPISIENSPMMLVAIPMSLAMVGWYYLTFEREPKPINFKYGEKTFALNKNYIYGGLLISLAGMLKYQSMIFYAGFMVMYGLYLLVRKQFKDFKELIKIGIIQSLIFIIVCGWWLYSFLWKSGIWERVLFEGTERVREYSIFYYFIDTFPQTLYLSVFAFVPLFFSRGREWFKNNARLVIIVLSILVIASFLITNQQLRYAIHFVPFLFILIVKGLDMLSNKVGEKTGKNKITYIVIFGVAIIALIISGINQITDENEIRGKQSLELVEYTKSLSNPKLLIYIHNPKNVSSNYYANPDMWMFGAMMANSEYNPQKMQQYMRYMYWSSFANDYKSVINAFDEWSTQIRTVIIVPKYREGTKPLDEELMNRTYTKKELELYNVYER